MPYTRSWSDATPAGTRAANQIDDAIREFKVDVHERMDTLVDDWTDDPVVLKDEFKGGNATKYIFVGPMAFHTVDDEDDNNWRSNHFQPEGGKTARAHFTLPPGVTFIGWSATVDAQGGGVITCTVSRIVFSTGVQTALNPTQTWNAIAITKKDQTIGTPEDVTNDRYYLVEFAPSLGVSGPKIYGFRALYECPDSRSTF